MRGKLISISGSDGAGKSTQLELLQENLKHLGIQNDYFQFDATCYGEKAQSEIRRLEMNQIVFTRLCIDWSERYPLMKDFVYDETLQNPELALAVTAIFAGGCMQVYNQCIRPLLDKGIHVICDRFWLDDLVYRGVWLEENVITQLYRHIPLPDLSFLLKLPWDLVKKRNFTRIDGKSPLMKSEESIRKICGKFDEVQEKYAMVVIDGNRDKVVISNEILKKIVGVLELD